MTTPPEGTKTRKGWAQTIREIKGIATAIVLAVSGFAWNKVESCMDRDFNQNVQKSSYQILQPQIDSMKHQLNECAVGLEVWKRTQGADSNVEELLRELLDAQRGEAAVDAPPPDDDDGVAAASSPKPPKKGKHKKKGKQKPSEIVASDMILDDIPQVQVIQAPNFEDIVQHVKKQAEPLNMEQWQAQTQEQFQDETK